MTRRRAPVVYVSPTDPWPPWLTLDEHRAAQLSTGDKPVYHTEARDRRDREWGEKAGLRWEPLEHEPE